MAATTSLSPLLAKELNIVHGAIGRDNEVLRAELDRWEEQTGHSVNIVQMPSSSTDQFGQYRLWLAAQNDDIDIYRIDVIWAPQIAEHFIDLSSSMSDIVGDFLPAAIDSQTVDGKLVALPMFVGAPALYYRSDLLEKYDQDVPETWGELTETAKLVMEKERAAGNDRMWGFVWQGNAYEGLTCNALEWIASSNGGHVIEADGSISVNNENAIAALELAASWVGDISPEGVLAYTEEEARGVFQGGNAVFMRNWNYAYALAAGDDSAIKGKFDVAPLPHGEGGETKSTLGGWHLGVSRYSENQELAIELVKYLNNPENQIERAIETSRPPTRTALYENEQIAEAQPFIPLWAPVVENALPRPAAATKEKYNEASSLFWSAVHDTLSGRGTASENLELLELELEDLRGDQW